MRIVPLVLALLSLVCGRKVCDTCLEGFCYGREVILENHRLSGQLAIDTVDNILYFHYKDSYSIDHTVAYDLDDVRLKSIPGIDFSFARAVDLNRNVYIGGTQGIFKYDPRKNLTTEYGLFDKTIWHMQFRNMIYYTVFMMNGLYTYQDKKSVSITNLTKYKIDDFIIDNRNDIFFVSESKLYRYEGKSKQINVVSNNMYSLLVDKYNNGYFIDILNRGLYRFSHRINRLFEVGAFDSGAPFKAVFDSNNNIIYYDKSNEILYYLRPNYGRCKISRGKRRQYKSMVSIPRNSTSFLQIKTIE